MSDETTLELRFDEPGKSYCGTVTLRDGVPVCLTGYIWKVDSPWQETFAADVSEASGVPVRVKPGSFSNNNGHPYLEFEPVPEGGCGMGNHETLDINKLVAEPEDKPCDRPESQWGPDFKWELPSRAIVACRNGVGAVLWFVGAHLTYEMQEGPGTDLCDLGLDDAPDGISVWEGTYHYDAPAYYSDGEPGYPEPKGSFRQPTPEEWAKIQQNECPWNEADWKEPDADAE